MEIKHKACRRNTQKLICTLLFVIEIFAAVSSAGAYAIPEEELNPDTNQPSIEILALSRGRGVPESTYIAFQEILTIANTALKSGSAMSVRQKTMGLEGETQLCIVFRDIQALATIGNKIRTIASNVDLLQVNDNRCFGV